MGGIEALLDAVGISGNKEGVKLVSVNKSKWIAKKDINMYVYPYHMIE